MLVVQRPGFSIDVRDSGVVVVATGAVDEDAGNVLRDALADASADYTRSITLDLTEVTFLPSSAVAVLARAQRRLASGDGELALVAKRGSIAQRVLEVCAFEHVVV